MTNLAEDPLHNAVYMGIKRGIDVALANECYGSAVILILSAIDAMAYLSMLQDQEDVTKLDFIGWAERYIRFDCKEQLTGADLYGARCAMLHSYGVRSSMSRKGECRLVGYMSEAYPPVQYNPKVSTELVLVSVPALRDALFKAIDTFLIELYANPQTAKVAEGRLKNFVVTLKGWPPDAGSEALS